MISLKSALFTTSIISGVAFATVAAAQTQPAPPTEAQPTTVTDIVVTGSRIRLPDYVAPNPVQSITSEDFDRSGQTNLTNFLTEVPALSGSLNSSGRRGHHHSRPGGS